MDIITGTKDDLRQLINGAYQRLRHTDNNIEKYVLIDYLAQLHELESAITGEESEFDGARARLSNSKQRRYMKYMDSLFNRLDDEFIKFKEYHRDHFDAMLAINDDELENIVDNVYVSEYSPMSKEEFCEYFFEFLSEYGLEEYFDKLISGRKIFNRPLDEKAMYAGNVLYDPTKKRSSMVLCDFEYTVPYLLTMGHELGHVVDLSKLNKKEFDTYMRYSYSSVYGETISMIFEKLFYDFLFKKRYRIDEVKEIYSEFSFEGKKYILDGYLLSLLDDQTIRRLPFDCVSDQDILKEVDEFFIREDELLNHLEGRRLSTWKTPLYGYGDYFSTILKDNIHNEGFDSRLMRKFMELRTGEFNPDLLEDIGFELSNYQMIYKRDISRLKK